MALSPEQIAQLKKMPGINQDLLSAYEKGGQNLSGAEQEAIKKQSVTPERITEIASKDFVTSENKQSFKLPSISKTETAKVAPSTPQERVSNFATFSAGLQEAVGLARQKRQSAELDFLKGAIPEGAVSASSFTSLLSNLNRASDRFTQPLVESTLDEASRISQDLRDSQDSIRELALSMIDSGASSETVASILEFSETGDIDSALKVASHGYKAGGNKVVEKVGTSLVTYDPADPDNTTEVIYTAPTGGTGGSGSTGNTGFFYSGAVRIADADLGELATELNDSQGDDGFANTSLYVEAYNKWVQSGGLPQDFFKQFDPDFYLNPGDPTIPIAIRNTMKSESDDSTLKW